MSTNGFELELNWNFSLEYQRRTLHKSIQYGNHANENDLLDLGEISCVDKSKGSTMAKKKNEEN